MQSSALKGFIRAFAAVPVTGASTALPVLLVTTISARAHRQARHARARQPNSVRYLGLPSRHQEAEIPSHPVSSRSDQDLPIQAIQLLQTRQQRKSAAWIAVIELYLPDGLRSPKDQSPPSQDEKILILPIGSLSKILDRARKTAKVDLLSHIAIFEERPEAAIWLMRRMLEGCPSYSTMASHSQRLPDVVWSTEGQRLDDVTKDPIAVRAPMTSNFSLQALAERDRSDGNESTVSQTRHNIGQIWQSLGCMILQAEDRPADDPGRRAIMSNVSQILADMHHLSVLPDSIYNYEPANDGTVIQRPPTLYLLSARIMTALSDVAWKSHWVGEMAKAKSYGYDLPPPRVEPQLPFIGAEIWLELVLWACVEGGWISEAVWLVSEMERRNSNPSLCWSTISWEQICSAKKPQLAWTALLKLQIDRTRLNQATGIGIANNGISTVEMGRRTISREVILSIMDGLANTFNTDVEGYGRPSMQIHDGLMFCKRLLERNPEGLDPALLNALVLRCLETSDIDSTARPGYLQRLLALTPKPSETEAALTRYKFPTDAETLDLSAAVLGLLHRSLGSFARQINLRGSLQAFKHIQDIIDANRAHYIKEFADNLRHRLQNGSDGADLINGQIRKSSPVLYPEIPIHVMENFLDLIMATKSFDIGDWLLFNNDIDGGAMTNGLFTEPNLQPALIRFATATLNDPLLAQVLQNLENPLSETILHALVRCQIALDKWDAVDEILKHFSNTAEMSWTDYDAMYIAAAITRMERSSEASKIKRLPQAQGTLQDLVNGKYNGRRGQSRTRDLQAQQKANQLRRIYQSRPGALGDMFPEPVDVVGRAHYSASIHADAFNILLEAVVDVDGPSAGMRLWKRWCSEPEEDRLKLQGHTRLLVADRDRVVQPSLPMLYTILGPAIEKLKAFEGPPSANSYNEGGSKQVSGGSLDRSTEQISFEEALLVFRWAMEVYKCFGESVSTYRLELPESLGKYLRPESI